MVNESSKNRVTTHVADSHEDWFSVQVTFAVPKTRIETDGSLERVILPVIEQAEAAGRRWSPPHIYVMELRYGFNAYTSVHRSYQGARRTLTDCCAAWGILDLLADSEMGAVGAPDTCLGSGEEGNQFTYSISYLEIEE
jgi:hypothetical protein